MTEGCIAPKHGPKSSDRSPCPYPREPGSMFCRVHEQAPAVQRGGWLSAERRRRKRLGAPLALDLSNIVPRLWISSMPPLDRDLPGFDVMALCAPGHHQGIGFGGRFLACPLPVKLSTYDVRRALMTARAVATALREGYTVLVACTKGHNESALVAGLGLGIASRMSPGDIITLLRKRRSPECLSNRDFVDVLHRYLAHR